MSAWFVMSRARLLSGRSGRGGLCVRLAAVRRAPRSASARAASWSSTRPATAPTRPMSQRSRGTASRGPKAGSTHADLGGAAARSASRCPPRRTPLRREARRPTALVRPARCLILPETMMTEVLPPPAARLRSRRHRHARDRLPAAAPRRSPGVRRPRRANSPGTRASNTPSSISRSTPSPIANGAMATRIPKLFDPTDFSPDQIVAAAKAGGMRGHHPDRQAS